MYRVTLVKLFGFGGLIVVTGSMEPTINQDEMIIIKEQKNYMVDDIITYRDKFGQLITHRIYEIDGKNIVTKGDSNNEPDETITIDKIEGKVILHSVILGFLFLHMLKPLLIIIVIWYILSWLKYIFIAKIFFKLC
jgi:signal peptidase I